MTKNFTEKNGILLSYKCHILTFILKYCIDSSSKRSNDLLELEFHGAPRSSAASTPTGAYSGLKSPPLNAPPSGHSTPSPHTGIYSVMITF